MEQQHFHLISHALCPYVQRSVITLEEKDIRYTRTDIDLANKPVWFKQKSPMSKVPLLLVDDDYVLFESAVICEYLDEVTIDSIHPTNSLEKAQHRAWIEFGSGILQNIAHLYNAKDKADFDNIHAEIQQKFSLVEATIGGLPFYVGDKFHMIDATFGPIFRYFDVFDQFSDLNTFHHLPRCQTWRSALRQRKSVQQAASQEYPELLMNFLISLNSYMSRIVIARSRRQPI